MICFPRAAVMFNAPNLCSGAPPDPRMLLMKPRMGRKVTFVRLVARARRKVVAAATGVVKDSYSSARRILVRLGGVKSMNDTDPLKREHSRRGRYPTMLGGTR